MASDLVTFQSAGAIQAEAEKNQEIRTKATAPKEEVINALSAFLENRWNTAKTSKRSCRNCKRKSRTT